ncbi:MAG: hypothetical protein MUP58_01530 [Candidatus Nanohaloarchaeota archaeon QJJ-9]|nr:hypothetical protein [Candidatus Nanohaloarchaeota archaeon QJJ-9]
MAPRNQGSGSITGIKLTDDSYFVKQHMVRNKYEVYDSTKENLVLKAKQKLFKMKEEIPFTDSEGREVFSIKAHNILDIAGDYALVDKRQGQDRTLAVLKKDFTFFRHKWRIKDPEGNELAKVTSRSFAFDVLRTFSSLFNLLPFKYTIEAGNGARVGTIKEKLSFKDKYWVRIEETGSLPKETLIASAIAVDALEGR